MEKRKPSDRLYNAVLVYFAFGPGDLLEATVSMQRAFQVIITSIVYRRAGTSNSHSVDIYNILPSQLELVLNHPRLALLQKNFVSLSGFYHYPDILRESEERGWVSDGTWVAPLLLEQYNTL